MELTLHVNVKAEIHHHHHHGGVESTLQRLEVKVNQALAQGVTLMSAVDQINTYLGQVNQATNAISAATTSQATSLANIAADINRLANSDLPPAVQNQLAAHAAALQTAADNATAQAQALADLAAVTPEPAPPVEDAPADVPPAEVPADAPPADAPPAEPVV